MTKMKLAGLMVAVLAVGFVMGFAGRGLLLRHAHVEGVLQFEAPQGPEVTPSYPPGYYVTSRVYLDGATDAMLGKRILATGRLGVLKHPETQAYPCVEDHNIVIGREFPNQASHAIGAEATPQHER